MGKGVNRIFVHKFIHIYLNIQCFKVKHQFIDLRMMREYKFQLYPTDKKKTNTHSLWQDCVRFVRTVSKADGAAFFISTRHKMVENDAKHEILRSNVPTRVCCTLFARANLVRLPFTSYVIERLHGARMYPNLSCDTLSNQPTNTDLAETNQNADCKKLCLKTLRTGNLPIKYHIH